MKGKVIVDDDRVRDTKGVEIHTVDAVGVHFIVEEDLLHAALCFSEG